VTYCKFKAIKVLFIRSAVRPQNVCQLTAKMTCGLNSLTLAVSERFECGKFESLN